MQKFDLAFSYAARRIGSAATRTAADYSQGRLPEETDLTASLVSRIHDSLHGRNLRGIKWEAHILTSHGSGTEERQFGADLVGVLELRLSGLAIKKGFIAQAKRQEPGNSLPGSEWARLRHQCDKMLRFTPESFVLVYALNGFVLIPAVSVCASAKVQDMHTLHPKKISEFYKEHFRCFVGDSRITEADTRVLEGLEAKNGLLLVGKAEDRTD